MPSGAVGQTLSDHIVAEVDHSMTAGILKSWLAGSGRGVLWLEYDDYAGKVFAGAPADWLADSVRFANTLAQARKVVPTQVLTIDLTAPCLARARGNAGGPSDLALRAIDDPKARAFVIEVVEALAHKFANEADLVLRLASPRDFLRALGAETEPSFDELDDVASAMAGLVRMLAEKPVAGLLVSRIGDLPWSADEGEACDPLFSAAHHYGWTTSLALEPALMLAAGHGYPEVDILLCSELGPDQLTVRNGGWHVGGGVGRAYWTGDSSASMPVTGGLLYGIVPATGEPEAIIARCSKLPARLGL